MIGFAIAEGETLSSLDEPVVPERSDDPVVRAAIEANLSSWIALSYGRPMAAPS